MHARRCMRGDACAAIHGATITPIHPPLSPALSIAQPPVLLLCASASRAAVVGYQEGARHRVECTGFVRGLQLHFTSYTNPEFTEPYLIGVRVMCST